MAYRESFEYELHHTEVGSELLKRYDILEEIYQSENSRIFKIGTTNSKETLLLKVIKKHSEFEFSIDKALKLDHKGISKIYDYMESERYLYLIKEYVEGQDLEHYVEEHGRLEEDLVKEITLMLTDILNYLHNYNGSSIIFRDLKPSNIIVTPDGQVKLIDIVTLREINESKETDTFYVGSRGYSAPEQFGYMQSKPTSDVYSLGATIYFLITGEHPQVTMNFNEMEELSPKYSRIVRRAMEFNPKDRYSSVNELAVDITSNKRVKKLLGIVMSIATLFIMAFIIYYLIYLPSKEAQDDHGIMQEVPNNLEDFDNKVEETATELESETETETETESAKETAIAVEIVSETEQEPLSVPEEGKFNPLIYATEEAIDLSQLIEIDKGFRYDYLDNRVLKVYMQREELPSPLQDFKYIYVYKDARPIGTFEAKKEIYNCINDPNFLDVYLPVGYEVDLSKADHTLIILFADDFEPLGYLFYNDIPFEEEAQVVTEVLGTVDLAEGIKIDYYRDFGKLHIDASKSPEFSKFTLFTVESSIADESVLGQHRLHAEGDKSAFDYYGDPFTFGWGINDTFQDYDYVLFLQNDDYEVLQEYYVLNIDDTKVLGSESISESGNKDDGSDLDTSIAGEIEVAQGIKAVYVDYEVSFILDQNLLPSFDGYHVSSISASLKEDWALETIYGLVEDPESIWDYGGGDIQTSVPKSTNFLKNDWAIFIYEGTALVGEYFIYNL